MVADAYSAIKSYPLNKMAAILTDDKFKCIFLNENKEFRFEFLWNLFLMVQLAIFQRQFR